MASNKIFPGVFSIWLGNSLIAGYLIVNQSNPLVSSVVSFSLLLTLQAFFTLFWMLYAWDNPREVKKHQSPGNFAPPTNSFTALLPARHESKVINETITAVSQINYPSHLKEILVIVREDDVNTIAAARKTIDRLSDPSIKLITFDGFPINKPHSLNVGLLSATKDIVAVFDAEDQPHPDIYNIVNTVLEENSVDVVQSGVQLMNFRSRWFSALNVLEYFFWFKSGLPFFYNLSQMALLGGNTVFFRQKALMAIQGWDEACLTEDAEIGIRLAAAGAKFKIVYDEQHSTHEETPADVATFVRQRTRWNHGFLQILFKGLWLKLPKKRQRIMAAYLLLAPIIQLIEYIYIPIGIYIALTMSLPLSVTLFSYLPFYLSLLQFVVLQIGLFEFTKNYKLGYSLLDPIRLAIAFVPYQLLLMFSSLRAIYRFALGVETWEKTEHSNLHRYAPTE